MTKIEIKNIENISKSECFGCTACEQICPKNCIMMMSDDEGFQYPKINKESCINCGLCRKVCPTIKHMDYFKKDFDESLAYAAIYQDDNVLLNSSSGGAFSAIVNIFCKENFVVFGVMYDEELNVVHGYAETIEDTIKFRKSKYVQSNINCCYSKAKQFLNEGRNVLFTGTPCQIAGLKTFLHKDYDNLLCIDLVCHGVPNQRIFNKYIAEEEIKQNSKISEFYFRHKIIENKSWNSRNINLKFKNDKEEIKGIPKSSYLKGFHSALFYRPSCGKCKFANPNRISDITIADYWGIENLYNDLDVHKGVSLILVNSNKGKLILENLHSYMELRKTDINFAIKSNSQLNQPTKFHNNRELFFELINTTTFEDAVNKCIPRKPLYYRLISRILNKRVKKIIKNIISIN